MSHRRGAVARIAAMSTGAALVLAAAVAAPVMAEESGTQEGPRAYPRAVHAPAQLPGAQQDGPGADRYRGPQPVVGGHEATGEVPFITALYTGGQFSCTASLVSAHWVLTAEHCVGSGHTVRVGSLDRESGGETAQVTEAVREPSGSDVALLRIDKDIDTEYAVLGEPGDVATGTRERVYGWGYTRSDWTQLADRLKYSEGSVYDDNCNVLGATLCLDNDGDTAGGDSGGPMLTGDGKLVGTCTAGNKPTDGSGFGAYSDITQYRDWIDETIAG
ncbi:secreted trypsin-like serine protease [Streptomyces albus]|uniref:Secreted trypsin-like serine protease n=1 Tax=Streptomyces albus (strain ATCC 21838 / DSM 41398 / FERM P-419 / JCM 4703 / NBRC 107858) TaxID=1081613 RepID=A0A0B5EH04_STRA4|nr:secreted trypsin-like serine protease [Streptomyces albus]AOU75739.1 secreted trypsin-like serine protease [Streptomyces albus]AYN31542.1 hypothetical protein DUI70_1039 [Streptomyces albus]